MNVCRAQQLLSLRLLVGVASLLNLCKYLGLGGLHDEFQSGVGISPVRKFLHEQGLLRLWITKGNPSSLRDFVLFAVRFVHGKVYSSGGGSSGGGSSGGGSGGVISDV